MFSIVIPTLQKDNRVLNLLIDELAESKCVGEIIIIDNSCSGFPVSEKVRVIVPDKNLYVNPAWNLGVQESKYEFVGILNDDIVFPKNSFEQIYSFLAENTIGLLGLDSIKRSDKTEIIDYPEESEIKFSPVDVRDNCWGSAIFGRKENFYHIPNDIKIWCGDDYLFKMNNRLGNYKMHNVGIRHLHSNTSSLKEFDLIKQNDVKFYQKIDAKLFEKVEFQKKFDLFVSLGAACSCTQTLRDSRLQYFSYPFDWVYGSNFLDRVKILVNNFEHWLDKEDLISWGKRAETHPNEIFKNTRTDIVFNHDFRMDTPLEESFDEVKQKYDRRIARLLNQIENSRSVLFAYILRPDMREEILQKDLKQGYELLKKRFPNVDIHILYLFSSREVDFQNRKVIKVTDNITNIRFDYDANLAELPWAAAPNKLNKVFRDFNISYKHLTAKQKLKKFFRRKKV